MMTVRQVNFLMSIFPIYFFQQLYPPKPTSYNSECELSGSYVSLECPSPPGPPACLTDSRRDPQVSCIYMYIYGIYSCFFLHKIRVACKFQIPTARAEKKGYSWHLLARSPFCDYILLAYLHIAWASVHRQRNNNIYLFIFYYRFALGFVPFTFAYMLACT